MDTLRDALVLLGSFIALSAAFALAMRLLRAVLAFFGEGVDVLVALLFFVLIVPPLWVWEKGRRPMWRTLSREESDELRAWLRRQN